MNVSSIEFQAMMGSPMQRSLHVPVTESEKIRSNFYREFSKSTFHTTQIESFKQSKVSDSKIDFIHTGGATYLIYSYMTQYYPAIRVLPKFRKTIRICWTHNLAINTIKEARMHSDGVNIFGFSKIFLDHMNQNWVDPAFKDQVQIDIGNAPCMEVWNTSLPSYNTTLDLPFYYSFDETLAYPTVLDKNLIHSFTFKNKIAELLRMQELKLVNGKETWKDIPCKFSCLSGIPSDFRLPSPELWGRFSYNADYEIEWLKCHENVTQIFNDIITIKSTNPEKIGKTLTVELNSEHPWQCLMWKAENMKATANRYLSNYTTNWESIDEGWSPMKTVNYEYTGGKKFDDMDSQHFETVVSRHHFKSVSHEAGYNAFSQCNNPFSAKIDVGVVTCDTKPKFSVVLGSNNIFEETEEDSYGHEEEEDELPIEPKSEDDTTYLLHVCLVVSRKITFIKHGDNDYKILMDYIDPENEDNE